MKYATHKPFFRCGTREVCNFLLSVMVERRLSLCASTNVIFPVLLEGCFCMHVLLITQGKHFFQIFISVYCAGVHCRVTMWHPRISCLFSKGWNRHSIRNQNVLYDYKKNQRDRNISCLGCMLSIEFKHLSDVWRPDYL